MEKLLSSGMVCELLAISSTTLWRRIKSGSIPPPRKAVPGGKNFWLESEISEVINSLPIADAYLNCGSHPRKKATV